MFLKDESMHRERRLKEATRAGGADSAAGVMTRTALCY